MYLVNLLLVSGKFFGIFGKASECSTFGPVVMLPCGLLTRLSSLAREQEHEFLETKIYLAAIIINFALRTA